MKESKLVGDLNLVGWFSLAFTIFLLASIFFYPAFAGVTFLLGFSCLVMTFLIGIGEDWNVQELMFMLGGSIVLYSLSVAVLHALRWAGYLQIDLGWGTLSVVAGIALGLINTVLFLVQKYNQMTALR